MEGQERKMEMGGEGGRKINKETRKLIGTEGNEEGRKGENEGEEKGHKEQ